MRIPEANMEIRNTATGPLYTQLAAAIRGRIISGAYERGAKLPSESELIRTPAIRAAPSGTRSRCSPTRAL